MTPSRHRAASLPGSRKVRSTAAEDVLASVHGITRKRDSLPNYKGVKNDRNIVHTQTLYAEAKRKAKSAGLDWTPQAKRMCKKGLKDLEWAELIVWATNKGHFRIKPDLQAKLDREVRRLDEDDQDDAHEIGKIAKRHTGATPTPRRKRPSRSPTPKKRRHTSLVPAADFGSGSDSEDDEAPPRPAKRPRASLPNPRRPSTDDRRLRRMTEDQLIEMLRHRDRSQSAPPPPPSHDVSSSLPTGSVVPDSQGQAPAIEIDADAEDEPMDDNHTPPSSTRSTPVRPQIPSARNSFVLDSQSSFRSAVIPATSRIPTPAASEDESMEEVEIATGNLVADRDRWKAIAEEKVKELETVNVELEGRRKNDIAKLTIQIEDRDSTITDLETELAAVKASFDTAQTNFKAAQAKEAEKHQETILDLETRIDELKKTLTAKEDEMDGVTATNAELVASKDSEIATLKTDFASLQSERDELRGTADGLRRDLETSVAAQEVLSTNLRTVQELYDQEKAKVVDLEQQLATSQLRIAALETQLATSYQQRDDVQQHLTTAEATSATLGLEVASLQTHISNLNAEQQALNANIATLSEQRDDVQQQLTTAQAANTVLGLEVATLTANITNLNDQNQTLSTTITTLETSLAAMTAERDHLLETLEQRQVELQLRASEHQAELDAAQEELADSSDLLSNAKKTIDTLESQISDRDRVVFDLQAGNAAAKEFIGRFEVLGAGVPDLLNALNAHH